MADMTSESRFEIRPITTDEFDAFAEIPQHAFSHTADQEEQDFERSLLEFDRTLAAIDGTDLVASAAAFTYEMTVPGGTIPTAGISWVAVLPSHRRLGILSSLMRRQIDDIRVAGSESVAILWASEAPIYGRFGYGLATSTLSMTVQRSANALRPVAGGDGLRVRFVEPEDSLDLVAPVYDHDRARRPGMIARTGPWSRPPIFIPASRRGSSSPLRTVLIDGPDGVRGYARYVTSSVWVNSIPQGKTEVRELHGIDPAARWALWRHVTDLDLSGETVVSGRPPDEALLSMLVNPRAAAPRWTDALYVRLVEVGAAMSSRTYGAPVDVVIEVADEFCPWNAGRWHLRGDATGADCQRTDAAADLGLAARELGATYLGGTSLVTLADAGLVDELTPGAVAELSLALRHEPAPWSTFVF